MPAAVVVVVVAFYDAGGEEGGEEEEEREEEVFFHGVTVFFSCHGRSASLAGGGRGFDHFVGSFLTHALD
jgi:hypothetical protein